MSVCEKIKSAFDGISIPDMAEYYAFTESCRRIYSGSPEWRSVKKTGLYRGGSRSMNMLNTAKVLCDRLAVLTFAEKPEITFSDAECGEFVRRVIERNNLSGRMCEILSYAYAMGGCVFRPYICGGEIGI